MMNGSSTYKLSKCFAWSPHSVYEDLFAVGTSGGTIELCRAGQGQPVSPTTTTSQLVHSTIALNFQNKQRRACNDLAFCPLNANLLATTHDKNRSDCNLLVWDLTRSAPTFQVSAIDDAYEHSVLARSGGARGQQILRPGVQRSTSSASTVIIPGRLGILDARSREPATLANAHASKRTTGDGPSSHTVYLSPSETVKHVTFLPHNPNLLLAAVSGITIRLFDQRTPHHVAEATTTASLGLCCDPITGDRFGGFNPSMVQIWDHRRLADPLLSFSEEDAGPNLRSLKASEVVGSDPTRDQCIGVEFSKSRRGLVGTLTKAGDHVRLWDIVDGARTIDDLLERDPGFEMRSKVHWNASPYNYSEGPNTSSDDDHRSRGILQEYAPFLADTRCSRLPSLLNRGCHC
jgi:WD40 repeat protein